MTPNTAAFLTLISHSEGTDLVPDPYRCCYGYSHTLISLSDHPAITGEWMGEDISKLGPQYLGKVSTAAGRYQINRPTWETCKAALRLRDFTPPSQDDAALQLIKEAGALGLVNAGMIGDAITKCSGIWASLPGSVAGQPTKTFAQLLQTYSGAGGTYV